MNKSILLVYAHPDDETFSAGGTIAKYSSQGVDIRLVCATRGEAGKTAGYCSVEELGSMREKETREAAAVLGIKEVRFLDYHDKELGKANPVVITLQIANIMREHRPQVVITFGPDGSSGHQDHRAIHHFVVAAVRLAAQADVTELAGEPFKVPRVYFPAFSSRIRRALGHTDVADEDPETIIDTSAYAAKKIAALKCHRTQSGSFNKFLAMGEDKLNLFLSNEFFCLATEISNCKAPGTNDLFGECTDQGKAAAH